MSCDLEVTNETAGCWQTISSYITKDDKLLLISALCLYPITVTAAILIWWFNLAFYNHIIWVSFSNIFLKKLSKEFKRDAHNIQMWFIFYMTRHFSVVTKKLQFLYCSFLPKNHHHRSIFHRGTQREYNSKPLKHSLVKCILVFKR